MNPWLRPAYGTAARVAEWLAAAVPRRADSKVARTFSARHGVVERYVEWADAKRDASRPLLWIHAASVGEALMALPVAKRVRAALPRGQIVFTFFSPSAEKVAQSIPADYADYLPFDSIASMRAVLDAVAPTAIVFVKGDVWPALVAESARRRVKMALISASMPERSRRASGIASALTRDAYGALDLIGAASDADARGLVRAGAHPDRICVTGDTRYDQAWTRAHMSPHKKTLIGTFVSERPTIVAGSTWAADERELLPAFRRLHRDHPAVRLIVAPHEVNRRAIKSLEAAARSEALQVARLDASHAIDADVIVVDRVGVLADLYALATVAYVGGGFHEAGLHSLVEPAVFRIPTVIGPRHADSRDARLMLAAGGVVAAENSDAIFRTMKRLLADSDLRTSMSDAMGFVVSEELGAAERSFEMLRRLLGTV